MFEKHRKVGRDCFIILIVWSTDLLIDSMLIADTFGVRHFGENVNAEVG